MIAFTLQRKCGVNERLFVKTLFMSVVICTTSIQSSYAKNEDVSLPTVEIIRHSGYTAEVHHVTTADGYILELHRIPRSKSGKNPTRHHPVLIHHGFLGSSADWVLGGVEKSLPAHIAEEGFDVWLANSRGNTYSENHDSLSRKDKDFWNFSLHEVGIYDLPAVIDYILKQTHTSQLHYIGFSVGTTVFYIMASERPEYQPKVRSQISLAPTAYMSNTKIFARHLASYAEWMNKLLPSIMAHFPAGSSSKSAAHFAQFILKDTFSQYDYGKSGNLLHYNSAEPPPYNLSSINVPITLIYEKNDIVSVPEDVMKLIHQLPRLVDVIATDRLNCHVDFILGKNVEEEVYNPVKILLQKADNLNWYYYTCESSEEIVSIPINELLDDTEN